jgi:hypothetical protein
MAAVVMAVVVETVDSEVEAMTVVEDLKEMVDQAGTVDLKETVDPKKMAVDVLDLLGSHLTKNQINS